MGIQRPESRRALAFCLAAFTASFALAADASAQFFNCGANCHVVSGNVSDGAGGPFLPGHVYLSASHLTVPAGATLTIGAGAVVKFGGGLSFFVQGTLIVNGTGAQPGIITSIRDDVLGDHNGNLGATTVGPGDWVQLYLGPASDASSMTSLVVRGAGVSGNSAVRFDSSNATASDLRTQLAGGPCVDLNNNSNPTLTGCAFDGGTVAATNVRLNALAGFTGCTATGNSLYDAPLVTAPFLNNGESATVIAANGFNGSGTVVAPTHVTVNGGATLTLAAGTRIKFTGALTFFVHGQLSTTGTGANPAVITSIHDDAYGGDTNKNGNTTSAAAGQWTQLYLGPTSDTSSMTSLLVRCAGFSGNSAVRFDASNAMANSLRTQLSGGPCVDLNNNSNPTLTGCAFDGGTVAATNVRLNALAGFTGCTATGNSLYDAPLVTAPTLNNSESATVIAANGFNGSGTVVAPTHVTVNAGATLTLDAGTRIKFTGALTFFVYGQLSTTGTGANPAVITSIHDDAYGGDTNKNGNTTSAAAGQWTQLYLGPTSDTSSMTSLLVRCAGVSGNSAVRFDISDATASGLRTQLSGGPCMDLSNTSFPTLSGCAFDGGTVAATNVRLSALAGFRRCTATGNTSADAQRITSPTVLLGETAVVRAINTLNGTGAIHLPTHLSVNAGGTLDLGPGVVVKFEGGLTAFVFGTASWSGSGYDPVVFTSIHDDTFGGDSNANGAATVPSAGNWTQLYFDPAAAGSVAHVRVRHAGASGNPAVRCTSPSVTFNAVRVDRSSGNGFQLEAAGGTTLDNLVAWNCSGHGIRFDGAQALRHATAYGCSGFGVRNGATGTGPGTAINCIAFTNGSGGFGGFAAGAVTYSSGAAAGTGNIGGDPLLVDAVNGDLRLLPASPCLDVAEPGTSLGMVFDHDEGSRISDGRLIGALLPDLGAYELCAYRLRFTGKLWSFVQTTTVIEGPPGTAILAVGAFGPPEFYPPWGFLTAGPISTVLVLAVLPTGAPFDFTMSDVSAAAGVGLGLQALAVPLANPATGAFTNLYRGVLDG